LTVVTSRGFPGANATAARTSRGIAIVRKDWIVGGR
jgi:adenine/guanine phosphoribosyltransferase-like PRPP-binding protein